MACPAHKMDSLREVENNNAPLRTEAKQNYEYFRHSAKKWSEYGIPGFEQLANEQLIEQPGIPNFQDTDFETTSSDSDQSDVDPDEITNRFQIVLRTIDDFNFPERLVSQRSGHEKLPMFLRRAAELRVDIEGSILRTEKYKACWNRHFHPRCPHALCLKDKLTEYLRLQVKDHDNRINIINDWCLTGEEKEESEHFRRTRRSLRYQFQKLLRLTQFLNKECKHTSDNTTLEDPSIAGPPSPESSANIGTHSNTASPASTVPSTIKESTAEEEIMAEAI